MKSGVLVPSTEPAFRPLNKSYKAYKYKKGLASEKKVIHHFKKSGFILIDQRHRTYYAELDLIFEKDSHIHIVEVKSVWNWGRPYLSQRQKGRIRRAAELLQRQIRRVPRVHLALVQENEVHMIWDFLSD